MSTKVKRGIPKGLVGKPTTSRVMGQASFQGVAKASEAPLNPEQPTKPAGLSTPQETPAVDGPRIVGAIATSNRTVVVSFDRAMGDTPSTRSDTRSYSRT